MMAALAGTVVASSDPWVYAYRQSVGSACAGLMLAALFLVLAKPIAEKIDRLKEQTMEISIAEPELTPPPPPAAPAEPVPPPPVAQSKPPPTAQPLTKAPAQTAPAAEATPTPAPDAAPRPAVPAVVAAAEPPRPPAPTPPPAPASPSPPSAAVQADSYVAQLKRYLESVKRYPSSREARQTRPSGVVKVWFELSRAGKLLDAGIELGSGSSILDFEALKTVRTGSFPPMPEGVFGTSDKHRFTIDLRYELKSSE